MQIETTEDYERWVDGLADLKGRAQVQFRIERLAAGNPGKYRALAGGIYELKIDFGPGYRVYYTKRRNTLVILLVGGDKSSQKADIRKATKLAAGL